MIEYFEDTLEIIDNSLHGMDMETFNRLVEQATQTQKNGKKIVVSGLGKNVPICDKFVGSMLSLGLNANFLHTNSAVHGDMGMVQSGDLVIILTKSGSTKESVYLAGLLKQRENVNLWLLTFRQESVLVDMIGKEQSLVIPMEHEGDMWDIMPNNSTTLNLIVLQAVVMEVAKRLDLSLEDFKRNHPGGAIGETLKNA
jgi:arabinose-5-phosphate isomerase